MDSIRLWGLASDAIIDNDLYTADAVRFFFSRPSPFFLSVDIFATRGAKKKKSRLPDLFFLRGLLILIFSPLCRSFANFFFRRKLKWKPRNEPGKREEKRRDSHTTQIFS
jgi:hypothetical protein